MKKRFNDKFKEKYVIDFHIITEIKDKHLMFEKRFIDFTLNNDQVRKLENKLTSFRYGELKKGVLRGKHG